MDRSSEGVARARRAAFARWTRLFPEDAATLGLGEANARFRDPTEAGDQAIASAMREQLDELRAIDRGALSASEAIDVALLERHARFTLHTTVDLALPATSLEPSILAHAALAFQLFQLRGSEDLDSLLARLAALPRYLGERSARLALSKRRGHVFDQATTRFFAEHLLPDAAGFVRRIPEMLRARGVDAAAAEGLASLGARAFEAHVDVIVRELLPGSGDAYALGREEYDGRVASFFGGALDVEDLVREAREDLRAAQEAIVARARKLAEAKGGTVRDLRDAAALFMGLWGRHPGEGESPFALYEQATARVVAKLSALDLVGVPDACTLHMVPRPPGVAPGAPSTNWPVPLRDPRGRGLLLVGDDPSSHSVPGTMNLAVHEGIPGHYLQSFRWREIFGGDEAPLRFLLVTDDVAMAHQDFWAMPNIEGWAVRMEELCLDAGVHDDEEAMLGVVAKAIRALRVIGDVGLHYGTLDKEGVARLMHDEACMPLGWGAGQAARYARIGVQAITYAVGSKHIAELEAAARAARADDFSRRAFHDDLLAFGPVPPRMLRSAFSATH